MALVRFSSFYLGPYAVYTSKTGLTDLRTGLPELGGNLNVGDFVDLTESEAAQWSQQYAGQGNQLHRGRYRFCYILPAATAANIVQGACVGMGKGTTVQQAVIANAGSGYTPGTYQIASSTSGGTATSLLTVVVGSAGTIISASATPGAGFTSTPTWSLSTIPAGSSGSVVAQMTVDTNWITSFDSSAISLYSPRGLFLAAVTSAQVTAGAYVLIQEQGIGTCLVTTATNTALPLSLNAATSGVITSTTATSTFAPTGFLGYALDVAAASTFCRVNMQLPQWAG